MPSDESGREIQQSVENEIVERFEAKKPSEERRSELRQQHDGHLVRDTTSKLSVDAARTIEGLELDAEVEVPDLYCFTCGEWAGLSGVDLRGTPRSKADAYYLGGAPPDVRAAENGTRKTLRELADQLIDRVEHIEERTDAAEFIEAELPAVRDGGQADE